VDWSLTKDLFSIFGTIASAAGVGLAFYIGLQGLATWRRQLKGTTDHELAKKALIQLYNYKESVERARSPAMFGQEMQLDPGEEDGLKFSEINHRRRTRGYDRRLQSMAEAKATLLATLVETEAVWGRELRELVTSLFKMQHEFVMYVQFYFIANDPSQDDDYRRAYMEPLKDKPNIMYDNLTEEGDEFRKSFNSLIERAENYLRPKIA
jgi:hypothetical protein